MAQKTPLVKEGVPLINCHRSNRFLEAWSTLENEKLSTNIGNLFTFGRNDNHYVTPVTEGIRYSIHFSILLAKKSVI